VELTGSRSELCSCMGGEPTRPACCVCSPSRKRHTQCVEYNQVHERDTEATKHKTKAPGGLEAGGNNGGAAVASHGSLKSKKHRWSMAGETTTH
jgi:hypothetical protein